MNRSVQEQTGSLFGDLWHRYDDSLFQESVQLFAKRFAANRFDLGWFEGKRCLDAGCGGGRYTIAMAQLGAAEAIGCDISATGLNDARARAVRAGLERVRFDQASVLDLPYENESFDFVCSSGVLHHTPSPETGISELVRVLRPGGRLFLLLYGKGGLRWPTMLAVRPHAQAIGYERVNEAMRMIDLPANRQRTFLDDLFVPIMEYYSWEQVKEMLSRNGITRVERWEHGKLDHEASVEVQRAELDRLRAVFAAAGERLAGGAAESARKAKGIVASAIDRLDEVETQFEGGSINEAERAWEIFGWGHHRVLAEKD